MFLVAGLLSGAAGPVGPKDPGASASKLIQILGFTAEEQESLRKGEIVAHGVKELSDKELAITMAVLVPASIPDLLEFARSGKMLEINRDILSYGQLGAGPPETSSLRDAGFSPAEGSEIRDLFAVEPGSRFNLSQAEIQRFADLRMKGPATGCDKETACREAVVAALRDVLKSRLMAYAERGLSGIEPYARGGGKTASPAEELRGAANAIQFLSREYPAVFEAYVNYPKGDQSGIESQFLWFKQLVQDRPTLVLSHRMRFERDGMAFAAERQFYVGQSYNSLQILYGLFAVEGGTLVVYLNRTSTDQVAGFMSGTRHGVGRKIMEKEIRKHFEGVLASLKGSRP